MIASISFISCFGIEVGSFGCVTGYKVDDSTVTYFSTKVDCSFVLTIGLSKLLTKQKSEIKNPI